MIRVEKIVENQNNSYLWMSGDNIKPYTETENLCSCGFDTKEKNNDYCYNCIEIKKSPIFKPGNDLCNVIESL